MIRGTGIDIIEIERVAQAIRRWGDTFIQRVFTEEEIAYAESHVKPVPHYAARFAAKEAIFKAVSNEPGLGWKDIKILNDDFGKPICELKKLATPHHIHLSISHSRNYAVASAIITTK